MRLACLTHLCCSSTDRRSLDDTEKRQRHGADGAYELTRPAARPLLGAFGGEQALQDHLDAETQRKKFVKEKHERDLIDSTAKAPCASALPVSHSAFVTLTRSAHDSQVTLSQKAQAGSGGEARGARARTGQLEKE